MAQSRFDRERQERKARQRLLAHISMQLCFMGDVPHPSRLDLPEYIQRITHLVLEAAREKYPQGFPTGFIPGMHKPFLDLGNRLFDEDLANTFTLDTQAPG